MTLEVNVGRKPKNVNELNHLLQVNTDCLLSLCSVEHLLFHFSSVSIWCLEGDMYTAVQGLHMNMDALLL